MKSYFDKARSRSSLLKAWGKVYENGKQSPSEQTRKEIEVFAHHADSHIESIYRELLNDKFEFAPSIGFPQKKPGKKKRRPLVISPIKNRIVQRSLLQSLHSCHAIKEFENIGTSYGGIENRGVPKAIKAVHEFITSGYKWYLRSDISDFFTNLPRDRFVNIIRDCIQEESLISLLKKAIAVELSNMEQLGSLAEIFPIYSIGVAQGCCLSPLAGNIVLNEFDRKMNSRGIVCIRYIDDFILLSKKRESVIKAFQSAINDLSLMGLKAYSPFDGRNKAEFGEIKNGIDFLGCNISLHIIRPNSKSQLRLIKNASSLLKKSKEYIMAGKKGITYLKTLQDLHNLLRGWGNTYYYCNDFRLLSDLDAEINKLLTEFGHFYLNKMQSLTNSNDKRRLQGVHLLIDSKSDPIIRRA